MLTPEEALKEAVRVVPQWFVKKPGNKSPYSFSLSLDEHSIEIGAHRKPQREAKLYRQVLEGNLEQAYRSYEHLPKQVARELVQRSLVQKWLECQQNNIDWKTLINYVDELKNRTYENDAVGVNLVVEPAGNASPGITTSKSIYSSDKQIILDSLASSLYSYFRINGDLQFKEYGEVNWDTISEPDTARLHPSFLHPLHSTLDAGEYSVHLTRGGEILIMDFHVGVVATQRKGTWKIYDPPEVYGPMSDILGISVSVAQNLYEIAFDLSFKRHGALLVYDPDGRITDKRIANHKECRIGESPKAGDDARNMLSSSVHNLSFAEEEAAKRKNRIFAEIASMDGAVVFDDDGVLAFGAMLHVHGEAKNEKGARTTAAVSAYYHGANPIKISADGGVTVFFAEDMDTDRSEAPQKLSLL